MSITCLVADDHPSVREFLSRYLASQGLTVTATTRDGEEALSRIRSTSPAVAVLDARMPRLSGLDVARAVAGEGLPTRIVLYTGYGEKELLEDALAAGVAGMLDKDAPLDDLVRAIHVVAEGGTFIDASLGGLLVGGRNGAALTEREHDVLALLTEGLSNAEIAERLGISAQTVRTHIEKAMARLGAATRTQAVAIALRRSLIR